MKSITIKAKVAMRFLSRQLQRDGLSGIDGFFYVIGLQQQSADVKFSDGRSIYDDQRQVP